MAKHKPLLFELPFAADGPRVTNPALGINRVMHRAGSSHEIDITVLDTFDHRLLRSGVLLAHRVIAGLGDWFLGAPLWRPWLPSEHSEPLGGGGDLPDDLAELVRPFRRSANIGPVAAINIQRDEYTIKGADDVHLGVIRDEKIAVRRGGVTTARVRQVTTKATAAMTSQQRIHLAHSFSMAGGSATEKFPKPERLLGAPANGLTDFPEPRPWSKRASLEVFVSSLLATRLQELMKADLALRTSELARRDRNQARASGELDDRESKRKKDAKPVPVAPVLDVLASLRHQLGALSTVLEPHWREVMEADLDGLLTISPKDSMAALDERYFTVLDRLVAAVRAPQLGDRSADRAATALLSQAELGLVIVKGRCAALTPESPDEAWVAAKLAADRMLASCEGVGMLFGNKAKKLSKRLRVIVNALDAAQPVALWPSAEEISSLDPDNAFLLGRELQRLGDERDRARAQFTRTWEAESRKLVVLR